MAALTPDKRTELKTKIFLHQLQNMEFLRWLRFDPSTVRDLMAAVQEVNES